MYTLLQQFFNYVLWDELKLWPPNPYVRKKERKKERKKQKKKIATTTQPILSSLSLLSNAEPKPLCQSNSSLRFFLPRYLLRFTLLLETLIHRLFLVSSEKLRFELGLTLHFSKSASNSIYQIDNRSFALHYPNQFKASRSADPPIHQTDPTQLLPQREPTRSLQG